MADDALRQPRGRRHRRAVGPAGAVVPAEPVLDVVRAEPGSEPDDDERLRRDLPPHHDRGV